MPEATDMVSVLVKDHQEIKSYFMQLEAATDAKSRRDIADMLTAEVARHSVAEEIFLYPTARDVLPNGDQLVEEEEPKLFPEMQRALSPEQQQRLGEQITMAKRVAPTRPHPSAPDEPPMNLVLGVPMGIVDRIRDAMSGRETG